MYPVERLHLHLRKHHKSQTASRDLVYRTLGQLGPCTKQAIAQALTGQTDQATVYRILSLYEQIGVANVVRYRLLELSDRFKQHHHHFVCSRCDRETGFNNTSLEQAIDGLARQWGFQLESHNVELTGLCRDCAGNKNPR